MKIMLPQSVKACLWSYDTEMIDIALPDHQKIVIHNVLDSGTIDAVAWLRATFSETEITKAISSSSRSDWSKKSLSLWSLIYNTAPVKQGRFI